MSTDPKALAAAVAQLADLIDAKPEIAVCFQYITTHLVGEEARALDLFAEMVGGLPKHSVHHDGVRFTVLDTHIGPFEIKLQCHTEDYEKATGKTVDNTAVTA